MGKDYQHKPTYIHKDEPEYYVFKEKYAMIKIAHKINPETGYGEAISMGVAKAKGMVDNIELLKAFVKENEHECRTISDTAHLDKKDERKPRRNNLNSGSSNNNEVPEDEIPF